MRSAVVRYSHCQWGGATSTSPTRRPGESTSQVPRSMLNQKGLNCGRAVQSSIAIHLFQARKVSLKPQCFSSPSTSPCSPSYSTVPYCTVILLYCIVPCPALHPWPRPSRVKAHPWLCVRLHTLKRQGADSPMRTTIPHSFLRSLHHGPWGDGPGIWDAAHWTQLCSKWGKKVARRTAHRGINAQSNLPKPLIASWGLALPVSLCNKKPFIVGIPSSNCCILSPLLHLEGITGSGKEISSHCSCCRPFY